MTVGNDLRVLANSIIDSYEMRVKTVGALMNQANQLLRSFQLEIEDMMASLRNNLAKFESLRNKDFDSMMCSVIELCQRTEEEAEENERWLRKLGISVLVHAAVLKKLSIKEYMKELQEELEL